MAWNGIPAKDDPNLSFQAYYARLNIICQFLSPLSVQLFEESWEAAASQEMVSLRRSALVGQIVADMVRALALEEATESEPPIGGWFVHSGITSYSGKVGEQVATISLGNGHKLRGVVRTTCRITASAAGNMVGRDDVSFVVGRRISEAKFDLVAAGFRDPTVGLWAGERNSTPTEDSLQNVLDRPWAPSLLPNLVPPIQIKNSQDDVTLAFVVKDTIDRFSRAVRDEGAWKVLYEADGRSAHETRHQALFRVFATLSFVSLGITVHPNADHGGGQTDLTLDLRGAIHVAEFKKDSTPAKMLHGLQIQLPQYMDSAGARFGSYIVMCHDRDPVKVNEILDGAAPGRSIRFFVVDCRKRMSASLA
ncbi:hypothetical protein ACIQH6_14285 [Micromonospora orduensis]|uniref:hypothetical protein n=1 Tax=Micromonospora orduensis TaxID=1420891 RepID=UPI0037F3AFE4